MKTIFYIFIGLVTPILLSGSALALTPVNNVQSRPFILRHDLGTKLKSASQIAAENWSGYAASGASGSYNTASASWTQPTLNCTITGSQSTYSAYWVGLDGLNDQTVEQIGTEANCINNKPQYYAWYEMYPQESSQALANLSIAPGNQLTATVSYQPAAPPSRHQRFDEPSSSFSLIISDNTTGKSFVTTQQSRFTAQRSSAEVIAEAPYSNTILPLADFGTVNYTNSLANNSPIGLSPNLVDIIMQNPSGMTATPSALDASGKDFSVVWSD